MSNIDFNHRLVDMVERLATDYEPRLGIQPVIKAVQQARLSLVVVDDDNERGAQLLAIECLARKRLDMRSRIASLPA